MSYSSSLRATSNGTSGQSRKRGLIAQFCSDKGVAYYIRRYQKLRCFDVFKATSAAVRLTGDCFEGNRQVRGAGLSFPHVPVLGHFDCGGSDK